MTSSQHFAMPVHRRREHQARNESARRGNGFTQLTVPVHPARAALGPA